MSQLQQTCGCHRCVEGFYTEVASAFAVGAKEIVLVGNVEEAFEVHRKNPDYLLMGEVNGLPIDGFHFGNSPTETLRTDLSNRTLIHRTTAGTQGVIRAVNADKILTSSFVIAKETLNRIVELADGEVTFVITGKRSGEEDRALADYLEAGLKGENPDPAPYLRRVQDSISGRIFADHSLPMFPESDLHIATELDKFPFATEVSRINGWHVLRKV